MRLQSRIFLGRLFVFGLCSQLGRSQNAGTAIYFQRDDSNQQWCGYTSESDHKAKVKQTRPDLEGTATYLNNRLSKLVVFRVGSESGDWSVEDEYTLDKNGNIQALKRKIVSFPDDVIEERYFLIRDGKAIRQKTTGHTVRSNEVTKERLKEEYEPIVRKATAFPFWSFLRYHHTAILSTGQTCASTGK
ncbi:MAG: hypothetical protein ABIR70_09155 [Bryobacteraceae bacterium]